MKVQTKGVTVRASSALSISFEFEPSLVQVDVRLLEMFIADYRRNLDT